ncbi:hypothetical protein KW795_01775 [Candidatus Microgenomates bacterium]|nr:hypothetical protein [Candidatus Microgenomates bacterium]
MTEMNIIWKPEIPDIPMKIKMPDGLLMLIGASSDEKKPLIITETEMLPIE